MLRPQGWGVQYRMPWYERALLGYGVFIGLFFAIVCLGAFGFVVSSSLDGTLLPPAERSAIAIGKYVLIALFALWFGSLSLQWSLGSLVDLFGAEVVLYGAIEKLEVHRGSKGRSYSAVVGGGTVSLTGEVYATLAVGDRVWMRVGRFQRWLKELARPDRQARPPRGLVATGQSFPPAPAMSTPVVVDVATPGRARAKGAIPDDALRRSDVPSPSAPWTEVERFALTYDGATGPAIFELLEHHAQARTLPETLTELRAILYVEQRCHRHTQRAPTGDSLARVRAIIEAIRARVPPDA